MKKYLLPENFHSYKANLHCHSTWSDGYYTPEELKKLYKERGYSILSITDHEGLFWHNYLDDEDFLTIAGYETEYNKLNGPDWNTHTVVCHICAYKKDPSDMSQPGYDPAYDHPKFKWIHDPKKVALIKGKGKPFSKEYSVENINSIIKTLREEGFIVTYNHPKWSRELYPTYTAYEGMNNLEIFNTGTFRDGYDDRNGSVFDDILLSGKKVFCTASDDNHKSLDGPRVDMFGGFTMISAEKLDYKHVIEALENGWFYASTGPIIEELYVEDDTLYVKSATPLKYIRMVSDTRYRGFFCNNDGSPVLEGKFPLNRECGYMRLELEDMNGFTAWTNPYFVKDFFD